MARGLDNASAAGSQVAEPHLLIVDDDRELCQLITRYLGAEGFLSTAVHTGAAGEKAAIAGGFQLIVLDVMLPNRKGFDVLRDLRRPITTPVLMLTAKGDDFDRIFGLELGADDYLPKPFNPRELIARISAILRRSGWQAKQERRSASSTYRFGRSGARYGDSHGNARRTRSEIDFYRV